MADLLRVLKITSRVCACFCVMPLLVHAQSVSHGQQLVQEHCLRCHGLDVSDEGPALRGVVGRKAGKLDGYFYSEALALATHTWDTPWLRAWLAGPVAAIAGVEMDFHLDSATDIDDVIAYLTTLSVAGKP